MKCVKCGADLKDGASFCTTCGTKVEVIDLNQIMNSDLPDLFVKNKELMGELQKNYDEQLQAMKQVEEQVLALNKSSEEAKNETAEVQKKLSDTETLLKEKMEIILEKEREIFNLKKELEKRPIAQEPIPVVQGEVVDEALKCPNCGNVVKPEMTFCNQCGEKLKDQ